MRKKIAVVIPNWNGESLLSECLDSLKKQTADHTVIVVDNGSIDMSVNLIEKNYQEVVLIKLPENTGFAGGVNKGIEYALKNHFELIALLNNDAVAEKNWLSELTNILQDKTVGIATCKMLRSTDKRIDSTGETYSTWGMPSPRGRNELDNKQFDDVEEVFGASGGASMYKAALFRDTGLFDEDFFAYYEDVDISFRAQLRGWKVMYTPNASVSHHVSATSAKLGSFTRHHSIKNFFLLYIKNMPGYLFFKHAPLFSLYALRLGASSLIKGHGLTYIRSITSFLKLLPSALAKRRSIQKCRKVSIKSIDRQLVRPTVTASESLKNTFILLILTSPFSTLIVTWLATEFGGLYILSAWEEILLAAMSSLSLYVLLRCRKFSHCITVLNLCVVMYILICFLYVVFADNKNQALIGFALNTRFLIGLLVAQVVSLLYPKILSPVLRGILAITLLLSMFALLQAFILPSHFLMHFGYEAVGTNIPGVPPATTPLVAGSDVIRVQSTLRGPNPFGALLIVPLAVLTHIVLTRRKYRVQFVIASILPIIALYLTHSRSAWLGSFLAIAIVVAVSLQKHTMRYLKLMLIACAFLLIFCLTTLYIGKDTTLFKQVVLHQSSDIENSSNEVRERALRQSWQELSKEPLGRGIGTAGPASALSDNSSPRIAENYFLQVGQEIGWLGMSLLISIHVLVIAHLWSIRNQEWVMPVLAAFIGLSVTNLFLHTWADESVALVTWMIVGAALAKSNKRNNNDHLY